MKAEAALVHSVPVLPRFGQSSHDDYPTFSVDDFEGNIALYLLVGNFDCVIISVINSLSSIWKFLLLF